MNPVTEIRAQIGAKKSELRALIDAPCSHEEVRAGVLSWCQAQQAEGDRIIGLRVSSVAFGGTPEGLFELRSIGAGASMDFGPLLVGFVGAEAAAKLLDRHVSATDDGPNAADRAQGVARLRAEIFDLELEEERLIEASERDGMPITRRPDADPAAVLYVAADDELPAPRRGTGIAVIKHVPQRRAGGNGRSQYLEGGN